MHGNTSVHQAAASGSIDVMKCYLSQGVDVEKTNARGHSPLDLATTPEVKKLIIQALKTKTCVYCHEKFTF
jgi:ankyrin repeat protein